MTPGRLLAAAGAAVMLPSIVAVLIDPEPGSALSITFGFVTLGGAGAAIVGLVWLTVDIMRRRRQRRDARFAAVDARPQPEAPVVWDVAGPDDDAANEHTPHQVVRLRELDGTRVLLGRVDTSEGHDPAPPAGTPVVIVAHNRDGTIEFVNADTYYERNVAPEDDWIVLAHVLDEFDVHDGTVEPATEAPPPSWPSS